MGPAGRGDPVRAGGAVDAGSGVGVEPVAERIESEAAVPAAGVRGGGEGEASCVPGAGVAREPGRDLPALAPVEAEVSGLNLLRETSDRDAQRAPEGLMKTAVTIPWGAVVGGCPPSPNANGDARRD